MASSHVSLCGEGEEGAAEDDWTDGALFEQLMVLESSDRVRELQTILRDR